MNSTRIVVQCFNFSIVVRVKWGKEKYEGVELNTNEPPITFKMQLFSLTGTYVVTVLATKSGLYIIFIRCSS